MNLSPASLALSIANFQSQALLSIVSASSTAKNNSSLPTTLALADLNSSTSGSTSNASFQSLIELLMDPSPDTNSTATDALSLLTQSNGLSASGRNLALFDPESAYNMMTYINNSEAVDKAQYAELTQMKSGVSHMQEAGQSLGSVALTTPNDAIKSQLQDFVAQYNDWVQRFNPDIQKGSVLAGTQAAQLSLYELDQSIKNIFNGAKDGLHGLSDIGISIDPHTKLASLNTTKLDSMLAAKKLGVVNTIQEFSANFAKSASLLNAEDNVIPKQLRNLDKVIHYIVDNKSSLQQEFGTGSTATSTAQVAQALAVYNQTYRV